MRAPAFLLILFLAAMAAPARAQIAISPIIQEIRLDQPAKVMSFRLTNFDDRPKQVVVSVANWTINEAGEIRTLPSDETSLDRWVIVSPLQFALAPKSAQTIRVSVRSFLEQAGYATDERSTVASALEACVAKAYDAAVVDHMLPDGTALDLLHRLKEAHALLPVLILTGHGSIDLAVRAIQDGAAHFFTKPVELPALEVVLQRVLAGQRALRRERAVTTRQSRQAADPFRFRRPLPTTLDDMMFSSS